MEGSGQTNLPEADLLKVTKVDDDIMLEFAAPSAASGFPRSPKDFRVSSLHPWMSQREVSLALLAAASMAVEHGPSMDSVYATALQLRLAVAFKLLRSESVPREYLAVAPETETQYEAFVFHDSSSHATIQALRLSKSLWKIQLRSQTQDASSEQYESTTPMDSMFRMDAIQLLKLGYLEGLTWLCKNAVRKTAFQEAFTAIDAVRKRQISSLVTEKEEEKESTVEFQSGFDTTVEERIQQLENQVLEYSERHFLTLMTRYPSTPHLPFSPEVHDDDVMSASCGNFTEEPIVITEKLDGGNTCIKDDGTIFARTHTHPATHASFGPIKTMAQQWAAEELLPRGYALFGENMFGIHSIEYNKLKSFFYLFSAFSFRTGEWMAWDEVLALAKTLGVPTCPVLFQGKVGTLKGLQSIIEDGQKALSQCGDNTNPEGFVVRVCRSIPLSKFEACIAKYVRKGHVQTGPDWLRTWKKASLQGGG